jgi:hypothetical protein
MLPVRAPAQKNTHTNTFLMQKRFFKKWFWW